MRIKLVELLMVFFLLFCPFLGIALEDKNVIQGLIYGFRINSPYEESDEKLAEVLAVNCGHELMYFKRIYGSLGFNLPDPLSPWTGNFPNDHALAVENVKKTLSILHPRIRENLFKCLRENYLIPPISGEDDSAGIWYWKRLESLFPKSNTASVTKRNLGEASASAPTAPPAPSPQPSGSNHPSPKHKAPPPAGTFFVPFTNSESAPPNDKGVANSGANITSDDKNSSHKAVIVAVVVTAVVTFFVASVVFCFCRRVFGGGSGIDHKDDRPLLSLSMSDYSVSGSSPKAWAFENSAPKEKMGNQSYMNNLNGENGTVSIDGKLSSGSFGRVAANVIPIVTSANSSMVSGVTSASSLALKPPPGRTVVSTPGLPPLKPPPGRAAPLPPEPPASLRRPLPSKASQPPPPPPSKPPAAPSPPPSKPPAAPSPPPPKPMAAPPPPPPAKPTGPPAPPPPGPPPPPGKPGPRAPLPPKGGIVPPRPPPGAVKTGSSSSDADDNAAKAKLKPFFWDKVLANPDHSMVWHQIKSGSFQFNEEMIESLFGYAAAENKNEKKKESSSRDQPPQFIQLIDPKKAQNLSILLRALNVTTEEVRDALLEGNELPPELLETLLKMAPTSEEELKLRVFSGDISKLGPAERFLKVMVDIPFAFRRLEALLFMGTLQEDATTAKESFATLEAACKELRNSRLFLKLLEAVLKTGNRMNDGTFRGGAQAFKLDTLLKLADVRGTDGKTTLLHFVVQEIIRSEGVRAVRAARESKSMSSIKSEDLQLDDTPDDVEDHYRSLGLQVVSGLGEQLENVRKAACLDADGLAGCIGKLGTALVKTKKILSEEMKDVDEDKGFHRALRSFVQHAEGDIMWLMEEDKRILALVKNTVDYFHGNSGKEEGLRLFVIVRDFLIMLEKVCREVKERPKWPARTEKKDPPSRQTSSETPRTLFSPDLRQHLFPAIAQRRMDGSSLDDD